MWNFCLKTFRSRFRSRCCACKPAAFWSAFNRFRNLLLTYERVECTRTTGWKTQRYSMHPLHLRLFTPVCAVLCCVCVCVCNGADISAWAHDLAGQVQAASYSKVGRALAFLWERPFKSISGLQRFETGLGTRVFNFSPGEKKSFKIQKLSFLLWTLSQH